jgi:hypothetical protein
MKPFSAIVAVVAFLALSGSALAERPAHSGPSSVAVSAPAPHPLGGATCSGKVGPWACPSGQWCEMPNGACTHAGATGVCAVKPHCLPPAHQTVQVCGCDAKTYYGACQAAQAGVSVAYLGPCHTL